MKYLFCIVFFLLGCETVQPLDEATTNLNLWNKKKIVNYSFSFKRVCYCPLEYVGPNQIIVQNGKITSVNGAPYNAAERYGVMYTIPELLQVIKANIDRKPVKSILNFNQTYGYPTTIFFDFSEMIADEEIGYEITNFKIN